MYGAHVLYPFQRLHIMHIWLLSEQGELILEIDNRKFLTRSISISQVPSSREGA